MEGAVEGAVEGSGAESVTCGPLIISPLPHFGQVTFLPAMEALDRRLAPQGQRNCTLINKPLRLSSKGWIHNP
jgi:hypothetical protein